MSVQLQLCTPEQLLTDEKVVKILLPVPEGTLTVIDDKAPTSLMLTLGLVATMDSNNKILKRWFISGGFADVANNVCKVAADKVVDLAKVDLSQIELLSKEDNFYKSIVQYLKVFG